MNYFLYLLEPDLTALLCAREISRRVGLALHNHAVERNLLTRTGDRVGAAVERLEGILEEYPEPSGDSLALSVTRSNFLNRYRREE